MGVKELEAGILRELREVTGIRRMRQKDIMEWSTGAIAPRPDETVVRLPGLSVNVAYKLPEKPTK